MKRVVEVRNSNQRANDADEKQEECSFRRDLLRVAEIRLDVIQDV